MFVLHLALGGCLGVPPVRYGLTADTGGHIAYVLGAACAQSRLPRVDAVSVVTRLFDDDRLGSEFARPSQRLCAKATIDRVATANRSYLEKEELSVDLASFVDAFLAHLAGRPGLPDVIHAHFSDAAHVARAARQRFGIPFVYTPHALGLDKRDATSPDRRLDHRIDAERCALACADAVLVSTRDEADHQVAGYRVADLKGRLRHILPGVPRFAPSGGASDAEGVAASGRILGRWLDDLQKPILLAIARPIRKKNLMCLVRAFAADEALRRRANLVVLAGQHHGGRLSDEQREVLAGLREQAAAPLLRGCFALPPTHDGADVAALYRRAAAGGVFVNPALHEPFGLTLIEAAAAGVPVVATRHGGAADIVAATGHGLLVDPLDEAAIAGACLRILSDAALHDRLSRAGREGAHRYSWSRYAEQSVAVYAALRGGRRAPGPAGADGAHAAA